MKQILPIGTIIYLKEGSKKLMILNRGVTVEQVGETVLFDYSAAVYPMGLNPEKIFYFNHEDVDTIVHMGYSDEEETRFVTLYQQWLDTEAVSIKRGKTK